MYYKGTLRSTIHMSHRLRRKPPGLVPILVWSPWSRFLEQRGSGSLVPARGGHPGGRGGVGEHEGHESYLWVVSVDTEVAGGGQATGAGGGGERRRRGSGGRFEAGSGLRASPARGEACGRVGSGGGEPGVGAPR